MVLSVFIVLTTTFAKSYDLPFEYVGNFSPVDNNGLMWLKPQLSKFFVISHCYEHIFPYSYLEFRG